MTSFNELLLKSINFQIILGLLAFRVVSTLIEKVLFPLINIYLLDEDIFRKMNIFINKDEKKIVLIDPVRDKQLKYEIHFGTLIKEVIVFLIIFVMYFLFSISQKAT